jgi:hypothetical protein
MSESEAYADGVSDGIAIMKARIHYLSLNAVKDRDCYQEYQELIKGRRR